MEKMWYGTQNPDAGFHFIVEDYGTNLPEEVGEVVVLVCGTKPYEIAHTMKLLQRYETTPAFVLCPFVDKTLYDTYADAFQSDYHKVLFAEYQPDCMNGKQNEKVFTSMIETYIAGV